MAIHDWILDKTGELVYVCSKCGAREHVFHKDIQETEWKPYTILPDCNEETVRQVLEE